MNKETRERKINFLINLAVIGAVAALSLLFFQYVFYVILPFILSYLLAMTLQPVVRLLEKHIRLPKKLAVLLLVMIVIGIITTALYFGINRIITELNSLVKNLEDFIAKMKGDDDYAQDVIDRISNAVPFIDVRDKLSEIWMNIDEELEKFLLQILEKLSGSVYPMVMNIVSFVPNMMLNLVIFLMATYYFAADFRKINDFALNQFPENSQKHVLNIKSIFSGTVGKFLRAYGLLCFITFGELFAAFSILGFKYAVILALVIAAIDILPVLGTGTVLIPWAIVLFIIGDYFTGFALLISYAVITIIRQIIEPKIIGKYIGLYPLVTLISMYVGLKLLGFLGLFFLPITVILLTKLNDDGKIKLFKKIPGEEKDKK